MPISVRDNLTAVSVTVPGDGLAHSLWTLVVDAAKLANSSANPDSTCFDLTLQNDPDQAAGTKSIIVGNLFVSATNGIKIPYGASFPISNQKNENISLSMFYVMATGTSDITLNVMANRG